MAFYQKLWMLLMKATMTNDNLLAKELERTFGCLLLELGQEPIMEENDKDILDFFWLRDLPPASS